MSAVREPSARFDGLLARDLCGVVDLSRHPDVLDRSGWWAVVGTFEGALTGYRFADVRPAVPTPGRPWVGPAADAWRSSLDRAAYTAGVAAIRERIAAGDVYQVNLCRMLAAPLPADADPYALADRLATGNPAPHQGVLDLGDDWMVTASPELFLARDGDVLHSSPIKGTAAPDAAFADKDIPENIMITDLVRNDLGRIARPGSVVVTELLARQPHPGLVHLVSTVRAELAPGHGWADLLAATFPPGSVSGAPKISALQVISALEPSPRGPYCGAIGYVDADRRRARLAVGIRTFFTDSSRGRPELRFGTGAGITWASDPDAEWAETELKAARLVQLASR
jgi:para-aminobenzoate synthetase component 1